MKIRLPLYGRILGWFMLNLVLLAALAAILAVSQFHLEVLLSSAAGERVQRVADLIFAEFHTRPRAEWDDVLKRFSDAYRVDFVVLDESSRRVAGQAVELPEELSARLRRRPPVPSRERSVDLVETRGPPPGEPRDRFREGLPRRAAELRRDPPRQLIRTKAPNYWWFVVTSGFHS